ncbi:MAG: hypothetical protein H8D78_05770, partial [Chloroflexi bacterium]|nr:hypothetical protein [Chloroflexota bacterium]
MTDFIAFDLETARAWDGDPDPDQGLGISCAATLSRSTGCILSSVEGLTASSAGDLRLWHGRAACLRASACAGTPACAGTHADRHADRYTHRQAGGGYAPGMDAWEAWELADWLGQRQAAGVPIVTWNGLFDFHVWGVESGNVEMCARLAGEQVDLMFAFLAVKGFPLSLAKAAAACGSHKGAGDIASGADAPRLWAEGRHREVLDYLTQDVRATADVANHLLAHGGFTWTSNSGRPNLFELPHEVRTGGLAALTVDQVSRWPLPDT